MGGVDLHGNHCNNLLPCIRSKKWTWVVLVRLIQSAIVNALVIYNACNSTEKKVGSKDFAMSIARQYIENGKRHRSKLHDVSYKDLKKNCFFSSEKCPIRTTNIVILVLYIIVKSVSTIIIENYQNSIKKQKFEKLQKNTRSLKNYKKNIKFKKYKKIFKI